MDPYYNIYLSSFVTLQPHQMTNEMRTELKKNLEEQLLRKCYKDYGIITKIFSLNTLSGGFIVPEDPNAGALYNAQISCRLCRPLKNKIMVCEITSINKTIMCLRNGPIYVIILEGNVNAENFVYKEQKNVWVANMGNNKGIPLLVGKYVKTKIFDVKLEHNSERIIAFGTLESLATESESKQMIDAKESETGEILTTEEFTKIISNDATLESENNDDDGADDDNNNDEN